MTRSPPRASPARANLHRLDETMNPMTSDTLGVEELIERLRAALRPFAKVAGPIKGEEGRPSYLDMITGHGETDELAVTTIFDTGVRGAVLWADDFREAAEALEAADALSALLPKGVDRGGKEEEGVSQSQPVLVSNDQTEAEPSAALEPFLRAFDNYRHDGTVLWLCGVDRFGRFFGIQDVSTQLAALSAQSASAAAADPWTVRDNAEETHPDGKAFDVMWPNGEWFTVIAVEPEDARECAREEWAAKVALAARYASPASPAGVSDKAPGKPENPALGASS